jgi:hypothetical protein
MRPSFRTEQNPRRVSPAEFFKFFFQTCAAGGLPLRAAVNTSVFPASVRQLIRQFFMPINYRAIIVRHPSAVDPSILSSIGAAPSQSTPTGTESRQATIRA